MNGKVTSYMRLLDEDQPTETGIMKRVLLTR